MLKKTLVVGDLHLGKLGYSDYIKDNRIKEKNDVLNFIVEKSEEVERVVFLGDQFNSRNPLSETIKEFTNFLEKIDKEIFIIAGNHEIKAGGDTAIDYLKEVKDKNWHIITNKIEKFEELVFCPYFSKNSLDCKDDILATKKILEMLPVGDVFFHHQAMSGFATSTGVKTDSFLEIIFPKKELVTRYKLSIGGHIHKPKFDGNTLVSGSILNNEIGEDGKFIWIINEDFSVKQIPLPGRKIYKVENPTEESLSKLEKDSIIKAIITEKKTPNELSEIKEMLKKFDAFVFLEQIPHERKKVHFGKEGESFINFNVEDLLNLYATQNKLPIEKVMNGFNLIKE